MQHRQKIKNYVRHLSCGFTEETVLPVFPVRTLYTRLCENKNKKCLGFSLKDMDNEFLNYQQRHLWMTN
jgi:hypothetical protein